MKYKSGFFEKKIYQPPSENAKRYDPDPDKGLTDEQVSKRTEDGYINNTVNDTSKSIAKIILTNVFTYFNMIFFILAILLIIEQSYNHLTFLIVVFFNTVIGIFQEIRAKKTLEKLSLISSPISKVIRDGKEEQISSDELVKIIRQFKK